MPASEPAEGIDDADKAAQRRQVSRFSPALPCTCWRWALWHSLTDSPQRAAWVVGSGAGVRQKK
jgi:hypothetical protein